MGKTRYAPPAICFISIGWGELLIFSEGLERLTLPPHNCHWGRMFQPGVFLCDERSGYKPMGSGLKQDGPESWNKTRIAEGYLMVVAHVYWKVLCTCVQLLIELFNPGAMSYMPPTDWLPPGMQLPAAVAANKGSVVHHNTSI